MDKEHALWIPEYQCHKKVRALKIEKVIDPTEPESESDGSRILFFEPPYDDEKHSIQVGHAYIRKHSPEVGGYFVVYEDGYESFSPAEAFESGYTLIP